MVTSLCLGSSGSFIIRSLSVLSNATLLFVMKTFSECNFDFRDPEAEECVIIDKVACSVICILREGRTVCEEQGYHAQKTALAWHCSCCCCRYPEKWIAYYAAQWRSCRTGYLLCIRKQQISCLWLVVFCFWIIVLFLFVPILRACCLVFLNYHTSFQHHAVWSLKYIRYKKGLSYVAYSGKMKI